jgi:DNA excision repair protein ERCC-2
MAVKVDLEAKKVAVGVGDLVSESLAVGRVSGVGLGARLALGREAHATHQRSQAWRRPLYGRELSVRWRTVVDGFELTVQGRVDGVYVSGEDGRLVVEEVKSVALTPLMFGALGAESYPHYLEQLRLYCFLVERGGPGTAGAPAAGVAGRLVFVNLADGGEKTVEVSGPFDDCERLVTERVRLLIERERARSRQQRARAAGAAGVRFPHAQPRPHQDRMIAAVQQALEQGRHLLVSAPSGIGKTAGALYPAVKHALATGKRVFFVTAKNTQQQIARETLSRTLPAAAETLPAAAKPAGQRRAPSEAAGTAPVTAVFFRSRESMCINTVYACREEFCPHLQQFRAKLQRTRALEGLEQQRLISPEAMMEAGRAAGLCPFELALLEAERAAVVVCDYNYVFDPQVYLRRFFQESDCSDAILIIDEAHNLAGRAMQYYSPSLSCRRVRELMDGLGHVEPALARDFKKWLRRLEEFFRNAERRSGDEYSQLEAFDAEDDPTGRGGPASGGRGRQEQKFLIACPRAFFEELKPAANKLAIRYFLDKLTSGRAIPDDPVEEFFSEFARFCSVLALQGDEFAYIYDASQGRSLRILCMDPSRQLAGRLAGFHSVIAVSATLAPVEFYRQMLGFDPQRTDVAEFASPFPLENRRVVVVPDVLTTWRHRAAGYKRVAEVIVQTVGARPGNYMALFPSFEFLESVAETLEPKLAGLGGVELVRQARQMTEQQRQELLGALRDGRGPRLVLAVQGGLFAEGVDYPGEQLLGVIVVSPALPQVGFERELMRQYYERTHGSGFEYAYLYPGMSRVIQSVGRLIRSETDRGVAVLVCRRFAQRQYASLFPPDWRPVRSDGARSGGLGAELRRFWGGYSKKAE